MAMKYFTEKKGGFTWNPAGLLCLYVRKDGFIPFPHPFHFESCTLSELYVLDLFFEKKPQLYK